MIKETWEQILNGQDVRQNLSRLRQKLKEYGQRDLFQPLADENETFLLELLYHEDAKTRKNAALLLGDLGCQKYVDALYQGYVKEPQMFVKGSYLTAMKNMDYSSYLGAFKIRLKELSEMSAELESEKHIREEVRELSTLIVAEEGISRHTFTGWKELYQVILLTNRNFPELTLNHLMDLDPGAKAKVFGAGVMAKVTNLSWVESIRTYQELLFVVDGMQTCPMDAEKAAEVIMASKLLDFLDRSHDGGTPYYFRLEVKSQLEMDKRSIFSKKLSGQLEKMSERKLINSTSDYEFEIRMIENKEGSFNLLVKLYTLADKRFAYRKETVSSSIKPVNAALVMALTKDYLKEDAQVLDPFCGTGAMAIERHKAVTANTTYGIDILGDGIIKARENAESARQIIHFINKDFFDFEHEYLFDEIITNMPFRWGRTTAEEIEVIYRKFFHKAVTHLKHKGIIILYSHDRDLVRKYASYPMFKILECFEYSKKEGTYVFVIQTET